jgi:hypothetical protein
VIAVEPPPGRGTVTYSVAAGDTIIFVSPYSAYTHSNDRIE